MSPDDPRHGTHRGYVAHYNTDTLPPCDPCRRGHNKDSATRNLQKLSGRVHTMPARGAQRRVRALQAIGWSKARLAVELGVSGPSWFNTLLAQDACFTTTHERIAAMYDRLHMTPPPEDQSARKARADAQRRGHAPPLAWDDIDRDEKPQGVRRVA